MDKAKKEREEFYLSKFVSNPALGMIISAIKPMDPPDFQISRFIDNQFQEIGVELTTVTNPNLKAIEATQDKIVRDAYQLYKNEFKDILRVFVHFRNTTLPGDPKLLNSLSQELFEMIREISIKNMGYEFHLRSNDLFFAHPFFEKIIVSNELDFEDWRPFGVFMVPYIDEIWFAEKISRKEEILKTYRDQFEENWLVLLANFGHRSTAFQFPNLKGDFNSSPFDKIFIYNYMPDTIKVIK